MALARVLVWSALLAAPLAVVSPPALHAESPKQPLIPVKRHPGADPFIAAQIQVARLRQTADKLQLLANQTVPLNADGDTRQEFLKHEAWLRQAGHRVSVLAREWEQRMQPTHQPNNLARALDVNAFFESQSAVLQSKLNRENLALGVRSEPTRAASDTARLVIGNMN